MTRRAARITHDEVSRLLKAAKASGFPVGRIEYDGRSVSLVISVDTVETPEKTIAPPEEDEGLIREPKL